MMLLISDGVVGSFSFLICSMYRQATALASCYMYVWKEAFAYPLEGI